MILFRNQTREKNDNRMINAPSLFLFLPIKNSPVMWVLPYNQWGQQLTQTNYNEIQFFFYPLKLGIATNLKTERYYSSFIRIHSYNVNNNDIKG